jgi:hypothetical protein
MLFADDNQRIYENKAMCEMVGAMEEIMIFAGYARRKTADCSLSGSAAA